MEAIGIFVAEALIGGGFTSVAAATAATAYTFAAVAVATNIGVTLIASRLIAGRGTGGAGGFQDQGVRIQLPPSSENKIPIVYGHVFQQGVITDAEISNSNKTMTYTIILSEKTTTGNWSVGDIYWNDQKLNFAADGFTVASSSIGPETNTKLANKVRVWTYAGGTAAANQIQGPTPPVNAYDTLSTSSNYQLTDTVFSIVQIDYDSTNGITGLPAITYEITNDLTNPADVWYDYLTNARYGAGITATNIDVVSSISTTTTTSLWSICNEIPDNQTYTNTTTTFTSTQPRYQINGILNTGDSIKANLDRINIAAPSWTSYDGKTGKWKVISNSSSTAAQLESAFEFNDDNLIGEINLTSTQLEDIFNACEVSYANRNIKDQTDYFNTSTNVALRNPLEPDNILRLKTDLVNNPLHAGRIGNIELRQSRKDLVVTLTSDYSGLQVDAGDIVKLTNSIYGFNKKLFRVNRVREVESDGGNLLAEITAMEYDSTVYEDLPLNELTDRQPTFFTPINSSIALPPPTTATNVDNPSAAAITISTVIPSQSFPVDTVEVFIAPSDSGGTPTADFTLHTTISPTSGNFVADDTASIDVSYINYTNGYYVTKARSLSGNLLSEFSDVSDPFEITFGTLSGGSVTSAINADNILVSTITALNTASQYLVLTETIGDYSGPQGSTSTYLSDEGKTLNIPSIVVNTATITGPLKINPVAATGTNILYYNTVTNEVSYSTPIFNFGGI